MVCQWIAGEVTLLEDLVAATHSRRRKGRALIIMEENNSRVGAGRDQEDYKVGINKRFSWDHQ